ncbi:hypothetical protein [Martelella soudanensis]|uniref:hypothetical protein n=1 Tax=unclassified Martelella TaxID=2629616 RepID=UPI0015DD86A7|nr:MULTISPECIES: hypothetical protein [unclassified Martelella]
MNALMPAQSECLVPIRVTDVLSINDIVASLVCVKPLRFRTACVAAAFWLPFDANKPQYPFGSHPILAGVSACDALPASFSCRLAICY